MLDAVRQATPAPSMTAPPAAPSRAGTPAATLMAHARHPHDPATLAHAGVLGRAWAEQGTGVQPLVGLTADELRRLLAHHFPGADGALGLNWDRLPAGATPHPRADEVEDLVGLMVAHGAAGSADAARGVVTADEVRWLAHTVAHASLGNDHLWQDMGLPSRRVLSALMAQYFPALAARNDRDMKWKKFLYKQLCEREGLFICKAPSCAVCVDQPVCFGPEEG